MLVKLVLLCVFGRALNCADCTPPGKPVVKLVCRDGGLDCTPFTRLSAFKPASVCIIKRSRAGQGFFRRDIFAGLCLDLTLVNKPLARVKNQGLIFGRDDIVTKETFSFVTARVQTLSPVLERRPSRRLSKAGKE